MPGRDEAAPELAIGTPAGQLHELGALVVVAAAVTEGWKATYLGPNLPAEELAAAIKQSGAGALGLSLTFPADDPQLSDQLGHLRELIGERVALFVGGVAAEYYAEVLMEIDAFRLRDMGSLRVALDQLGQSGNLQPH